MRQIMMMSALICILQGQKDLPTAFDKQNKDQFVADCKEVNNCCCCSYLLLLLLLLMLIICLRTINLFLISVLEHGLWELQEDLLLLLEMLPGTHMLWKMEGMLASRYMNCISRIQSMLDYINNLYLNPSVLRQLTRTGTARFELPPIELNWLKQWRCRQYYFFLLIPLYPHRQRSS